MKNWTPLDYIVLSVTLTISSVLLISTLKPVFALDLVSSDTAKLIAGILGSLVSVISVYVGAKVQKNLDEN